MVLKADGTLYVRFCCVEIITRRRNAEIFKERNTTSHVLFSKHLVL